MNRTMGFRVYLDLLGQTHIVYLYMVFVYATNDCHWQSEFINESLDSTSRGIRMDEGFLIFEFNLVWLMNSNT
jgi:hypothetical protein